MDRISKLPLAIIETILCLVPIKDAARTSVLSKEWRYSWTKIPKLVFNGYDRFLTSPTPSIISLPTICKVLKMHEGTIDRLIIEITTIRPYPKMDDILDYLSEKIVKKLKLKFLWNCILPSSLFSLTHLTGLCLIRCGLEHDSLGLDSLGSLKTLHLEEFRISTENLVYFLSKCPLLKSVAVIQNQYTTGGIYGTNTSAIIDMFDCLPMIEDLTISSIIIECFPSIYGGPLKLPTGLVHLKYICIKDMCFDDNYEQPRFGPVLGLLLRSSPNLERLVVTFGNYGSSFRVEEYSDIWLEHLSKITIDYKTIDYKSMNTNAELELAMLFLAKSPVLKKLKIVIDNELVGEDEELLISEILSSSLHASPMIKIIVEHQDNDDTVFK